MVLSMPTAATDDADAEKAVAPATLSEDGTTITWKILSENLNLGMDNGARTGFQVTIGGIKANASTVGDGQDVTAVVSVGGSVVHDGSAQTRGRDNRSESQGRWSKRSPV